MDFHKTKQNNPSCEYGKCQKIIRIRIRIVNTILQDGKEGGWIMGNVFGKKIIGFSGCNQKKFSLETIHTYSHHNQKHSNRLMMMMMIYELYSLLSLLFFSILLMIFFPFLMNL